MSRESINLIGSKFASLLVTAMDGRRGGDVSWKCLCDCGAEVSIKGGNLRSGNTLSCGCRRRAVSRKRRSLPPNEAFLNSVMFRYQKQARQRGLHFGLVRDEFLSLITRRCEYCGSPPANKGNSRDSFNGRFPYNGVDRVDNAAGYEISNCVPCCKRCNLAKNDMSQAEWHSWMQSLIKWQTEV